MTVSSARIAANRANAARSTGPRTEAGKNRSRTNAVKHGLTGRGVALPAEDQTEITRSFTAMQEQLQPINELSEKLLRQAAFCLVRLERCQRHETAETAHRIRHAVEKFDDDRLVEVERLGGLIYTESATSVRRLQMTPEGIGWLLDQWEVLGGDLNNTDRNCWTGNHRQRFDALLGREVGGYRVARVFALTEALLGSFQHLDKADGEWLEGPERAAWARAELNRIMAAEVSRLEKLYIALDRRVIAADRAEAGERALFDTSKESTLARRYEAASERALYRALKEYRQVEAEAAEGRIPNIKVETKEVCDPVALIGSDPEPEPVEEAEPEESPACEPETVEFPSTASTSLNFSIGRAPKIEPGPA